MQFKPKTCQSCASQFIPKSGIQIWCTTCKTTCISCEGVKGENTKTRYCMKCSSKEKRQFPRQCIKCNAGFFDSNNKTKECAFCRETEKFCVGCNKPIKLTSTRCNKCRAESAVLLQSNFKRRYRHNGVSYRSKWEVEFATLLEKFGVEFEYEKKSEESGNYPDFFIVKKGMYVEIHPDWHGPKKVPSNCIVLKNLSQARSYALTLGLSLNRAKVDEWIKTMKRNHLTTKYKAAISLAAYFKTAMNEIDAVMAKMEAENDNR